MFVESILFPFKRRVNPPSTVGYAPNDRRQLWMCQIRESDVDRLDLRTPKLSSFYLSSRRVIHFPGTFDRKNRVIVILLTVERMHEPCNAFIQTSSSNSTTLKVDYSTLMSTLARYTAFAPFYARVRALIVRCTVKWGEHDI